MKVYFGGGETPAQLEMLRNEGVTSFAIDAMAWRGEGLPEGDALVYCSSDDAEASYVESLATLGQAGGLWIVPSWADPIEGVECAALWDGDVLDDAVSLSEQFGAVVVHGEGLKDLSRLPLLRRAVTGRLGAVSSSLRALKAVSWDFTAVHSWANPTRMGETQVWDGRQMHRYNSTRRRDVRKAHRAHIEALGLDPALVLDDADEATRLAIRSWLAWEASSVAAIAVPHPTDGVAVDSDGAPAIAGGRERHQRERVIIPTIAAFLERPDGDDQGADEVHLRSTSAVLRSCDSCFVAARCPQWQPKSDCAYDIPVEIKTKAQFVAVLTSAVEMQAQRAFEARFFEQVQGEEIDAKVSAEFDRLMAMSAKLKEITSDESMFEMTVKAKGGGVLSSIFGGAVGRNAQALPGGGVDSEEVLSRVFEAGR